MAIRVVIRSFLLLFLVPAIASADEQSGAIITAIPSIAVQDGSKTTAAGTASFGFRFNRVVGFEMEVTDVPKLHVDVGNGRSGKALMFLTNFRLSIPPIFDRLTTYVVGGGGVTNVRWDALAVQRRRLPLAIVVPRGRGQPTRALPSIPSDRDVPTPGNAVLTFDGGAGLSVRIWKGLAVDIDGRGYRLVSQRDHGIGRFGAGLEYRF